MEVDLTNQVVRVLGTSPVKTMTDALEQTGRKARLIGQGSLDGLLWSIIFIVMSSINSFFYSFIFIIMSSINSFF